MKRVYQSDEKARRFAEDAMRVNFSDPMIGLIVEDDCKPIGAIIINNYTPGRNIDVTGVGRNAWSVKVIRDIMRYCFARARRITCLTSVHNSPSIRALRSMGFKEEGRMREFFDDGDAIVFGLLKSEQKIVRL